MASRLSAWLKESEPDFADPSAVESSLPALYADLAAHQSSNRQAFETSVAWWRRILSQVALAGVQPSHSFASQKARHMQSASGSSSPPSATDRLVLHVDEALLEAFTLDDVGRPLGLGTVVKDLQKSAHLYPLQNFLSSSVPLQGPSRLHSSLSARAATLALSPLTWAMSQLSLSLGLGDPEHDKSDEDWRKAKGDWVVWENVEALTDAILAKHREAPRLSPLESLFSLQSFKTDLLAPSIVALGTPADKDALSERDVQVLLKHMMRDRRVIFMQGDVVKLEQREGQDMHAESVSESERGIVHVRETHDKIESQVNDIERRIKEMQSRIERSVKEKSKTQAISYLRSRKALEALRDKRVGTLETLHAVLVKIEQAASDVEVMKAYETSTSSLKSLLRDERLQPDRIDASMDSMQETLANADEVRQAVESGQQGMREAAGVSTIEEDEMEAELAALQKEVEEERKQEPETGKSEMQKEEPSKTLESAKSTSGTESAALKNREGNHTEQERKESEIVLAS